MKIQSSAPFSGINQDSHPRFQPEGTYRYALNAANQSEQGERPSLVTELGNELVAFTSLQLIGAHLLGSEEFVVFLTNDRNSEIGIYNRVTKTYEVLINTDCLNFSTSHPVDCIWRLLRGCQRVIYFTDNYNNYRVINIDNLESYQDDSGNWVCERFDVARAILSPIIDIASVDDFGGNLPIGHYQFSVRYLDDNLNPTPWLYITRGVNVVNTPISSNYFSIVGGVNKINSLDEQGAQEVSTKVINLNLNSLDTNFKFFQVAVLASTASTSTVSSVYILPEQPISSQEEIFRIDSVLPESGAVLSDVNEVIIPSQLPEKVATHAQLDNHLYLGNLEFKHYDWADFQKAALNIGVEVDITQHQISSDATVIGNSKNPSTPFYRQSLMGDEVYALAIEFEINGYKWSPAFHIPGRVKTPQDSAPINYDPNNLDIKPLPVKTQYETWEVYNTSNTSSTGLGYYETETNYPTVKDCNGQNIFPTDSNIRHHRMPSRRQVPLYEVNTTTGEVFGNFIGLKFNNITYPHPDITGHRFLVSKRSSSNSTVLDMGILVGSRYDRVEFNYTPTTITGPRLDSINVVGTQFRNLEQPVRKPSDLPGSLLANSTEIANTTFFISPKTLIERINLKGSYFSLISRLNQSARSEDINSFNRNGGGTIEYRTTQTRYIAQPTIPSQATQTYGFTSYLGPRMLQRSSFNLLPVSIWSRSFSNTVSLHYLDTPFQDQQGFYVVAPKKYLRPYSILSTIQYVPLHASPYRIDSPNIVQGGDVYISEFRVLDLNDVDRGSSNRRIHYASKIDGLWVESTVNYELRHPGDSTCNSIYIEGEDISEYWLKKTTTPTENSSRFDLIETYCTEFYGYNKDFSKQATDRLPIVLPNNFKYCSKCEAQYPRRIIRSKKSQEEFRSDSYLSFPVLDYIDLPGKDQSLNCLITDKDQLYALTDNGPYFIPSRPQTLNSSEETIYLLSPSSPFSIPPRKLVSTSYPYAGTQDKFSVVPTEFGIFYMDRKSSKVFLLSSSIEDLSSKGLHSFFENNSSFDIETLFKSVTGDSYPHMFTTYKIGIGYIATFDARYRRYILTKRDYTFLYPDKFKGIFNEDSALQTDTYWYDQDNQQWIYISPSSGIMEVNFNDPSHFINKSWTLSYNPDTSSWVSFHSYIPNFYMYDEKSFFSTLDDGNIWEHGIGDFTTYYTVKQDHIVDLISPSQEYTNKYNNVIFSTQATLADVEIDSTFDRMVAYNTDQSTGIAPLTIKTSAYNINNEFGVSKVDKHWKLSLIRDRVVNTQVPIFSSSWEDIQNTYPIDKVPNPAATGPLSQFTSPRFRDKFLGLRFYFKPVENIKLNTDIILNSSNISNR